MGSRPLELGSLAKHNQLPSLRDQRLRLRFDEYNQCADFDGREGLSPTTMADDTTREGLSPRVTNITANRRFLNNPEDTFSITQEPGNNISSE